MFRYGGQSWQGTGITTGLDTPPRIDLAEGGRTIGGGTIRGTPMGNRTGFDTPYMEGYNRIFGNPTRTPFKPINITNISEVGSGTGTGTTGGTVKNTVKKVIQNLATKTNLAPWKFNENAIARFLYKYGKIVAGSAGARIAGAGLGSPLAATSLIVYGATKLSPLLEEPTKALKAELEKAGVLDPLSPGFGGQWGFYETEEEREKKATDLDYEFEAAEMGSPIVMADDKIPLVPAEDVAALDIAAVLKETDGKITEEIKETDTAEIKLLDKEMENTMKQKAKEDPKLILTENENASVATGKMPLFDRIYGEQEADIKRNAWLMLAKFGARIWQKPVAEAAEETITDFEKIAKEKRDLRAITTMKEAEWEQQEKMQIMKNIATDNLTKPQQKIEQLTDIFQAEPYNMDYTKAKTQAKHIAAMHGSSETQALVKTAEGLAYRLNEANRPGSTINHIYDSFGWAMLLDKNLGTENMIRLPLTTKKVKKIVDGKTERVKEERFDFEKLPGGMIIPDRFYFYDDPKSQKVGTIYQYTGEGAITDWGQLQSALNEGTWTVYYK